MVINLESGNIYRRNALLRQLVEGHYQRNDLELRPGTFRVRGDSLDIVPAYQDKFGYRHHLLRRRSRAHHRIRHRHRRAEARAAHRPLSTRPSTSSPTKISSSRRLPISKLSWPNRWQCFVPRTNCSKPSAWNSAPCTTWKCCAKSATARASRTTRATWTSAPPAPPPGR